MTQKPGMLASLLKKIAPPAEPPTANAAPARTATTKAVDSTTTKTKAASAVSKAPKQGAAAKSSKAKPAAAKPRAPKQVPAPVPKVSAATAGPVVHAASRAAKLRTPLPAGR